MKRIITGFVASVWLLGGGLAWPAFGDIPSTSAASPAPLLADSDQADPVPVISSDARWVGVMIIVIAGLFVAAACIGPIVRANLPGEMPPAQSHDEPPGSSGHHGADGLS